MICTHGMLLSSLLLQLAVGGCPTGCLCASDILNCVSQGLEQLPSQMSGSTATLDLSHNRLVRIEEGSLEGLARLNTLRLAHNRLSGLLPGTFQNSSRGLRHLDLSSNLLRVVEHHYFQNLQALEELLLFNNRIVRVESRALVGLKHLHKVYLSHNRLTDFPFFSIKGHSHPFLHTLDLSSNRLPKLPLEDIMALPISMQSGLFLHNNTLTCDCNMYGLFRRWERRGFGCVTDFQEQHTCLVYGEIRASVRFFRHSRFFENCTLPAQSLPEDLETSLLAFAGDSVLLDCRTSMKGKHMSYLWVSPSQEYIAPPGNNRSLGMFPNGSLWILAAKTEDSGVYLCMVVDRLQMRNETLEVNLTVILRRSQAEPFNTGFTTLLGCAVSLVLVLIYLYLTPCRCWCCMHPLPPARLSPVCKHTAQSAAHNTPPGGVERASRKPASNKHVVFLEPTKEAQNGQHRTSVAPQPNSIASVFSSSVPKP
uniref:Adhesion molecule with Ig like domain 3 n=1 Tax=Paramormyrops kingsleyae TaxID=1676925 RepID=A0A3B3RP76_9TELE|nr:amphoterin-induced protein 3-like [Paramormyrops kingsleyae]